MISVIIPLFNAEKTIVAALDSVKIQTFGIANFEIIIINDGSTDESKIIVEKYITENPELNITFLYQENKGVSAARNAGLKICKGEFIAFLDADDVWLYNKTEKQMLYLEDVKLDIDFLATLRNDECLGFPYQTRNRELVEITFRKLLLKIAGQTSTAIIKRKVLENTGFFDENQRYSEDANYWFRISERNKMYLLNENLVETGGGKRSFGEAGLSANLPEMEKGIQKNIKELYDSKRINFLEYLFYYTFTRMKYVLRLARAKI